MQIFKSKPRFLFRFFLDISARISLVERATLFSRQCGSDFAWQEEQILIDNLNTQTWVVHAALVTFACNKCEAEERLRAARLSSCVRAKNHISPQILDVQILLEVERTENGKHSQIKWMLSTAICICLLANPRPFRLPGGRVKNGAHRAKTMKWTERMR